MADTIYTIPVSEAFETDCECPVCELKRRFENETVDYFAGPSLMEPDTRIITTETNSAMTSTSAATSKTRLQ